MYRGKQEVQEEMRCSGKMKGLVRLLVRWGFVEEEVLEDGVGEEKEDAMEEDVSRIVLIATTTTALHHLYKLCSLLQLHPLHLPREPYPLQALDRYLHTQDTLHKVCIASPRILLEDCHGYLSTATSADNIKVVLMDWDWSMQGVEDACGVWGVEEVHVMWCKESVEGSFFPLDKEEEMKDKSPTSTNQEQLSPNSPAYNILQHHGQPLASILKLPPSKLQYSLITQQPPVFLPILPSIPRFVQLLQHSEQVLAGIPSNQSNGKRGSEEKAASSALVRCLRKMQRGFQQQALEIEQAVDEDGQQQQVVTLSSNTAACSSEDRLSMLVYSSSNSSSDVGSYMDPIIPVEPLVMYPLLHRYPDNTKALSKTSNIAHKYQQQQQRVSMITSRERYTHQNGNGNDIIHLNSLLRYGSIASHRVATNKGFHANHWNPGNGNTNSAALINKILPNLSQTMANVALIRQHSDLVWSAVLARIEAARDAPSITLIHGHGHGSHVTHAKHGIGLPMGVRVRHMESGKSEAMEHFWRVNRGDARLLEALQRFRFIEKEVLRSPSWMYSYVGSAVNWNLCATALGANVSARQCRSRYLQISQQQQKQLVGNKRNISSMNDNNLNETKKLKDIPTSSSIISAKESNISSDKEKKVVQSRLQRLRQSVTHLHPAPTIPSSAMISAAHNSHDVSIQTAVNIFLPIDGSSASNSGAEANASQEVDRTKAINGEMWPLQLLDLADRSRK